MELWGKDQEKDFFIKSLSKFASPEQLFYKADDGKFYAYWPKKYGGEKSTLQSRNSLIGNYTEKWCAELLNEVASTAGGYAVNGVVCESIGLTKESPADVAICKTRDVHQKPEDIKLIVEVKMSIVWNWELIDGDKNSELKVAGNYETHSGNPGLLRSDTMLKAIGKSINIRVFGHGSSHIPIVIIGNTPIQQSYEHKVDHLKKSGVIQGFWSINPDPLDGKETIKETPGRGFVKLDKYNEFKELVGQTLSENLEFFSSMKGREDLGRFIELANKEQTYEQKAEKFLELLRE